MNEKLLKKLEDEKQWDALGLFERHAVVDRPALLEETCLRAAKKHDDAGALRLLELLLLAVDDVHAEMLRKLDSEPAKMTERTRQSEDAATADKARRALELLRQSPAHREGRWHDRETYEEGKTKEPTLLKYKQRLLEIMAQRWRETPHETEAHGLLGALIEAYKRNDPSGAEDLLSNAFRATKEHYAQRVRAMRGVLRLIKETRCDAEKHPARTLWLGLARTFDIRDLEKLGAILQHLPLSSLGTCWSRDTDAEPMIQAVARDAETYRKMHEAMRELRGVLNLNKGDFGDFAPVYPRPGLVELSIGAKCGFSARGQEENDFHDLAAGLRDQVKAWRESREKTLSVKLRIYRPVQHGEPKLVRLFELHASP